MVMEILRRKIAEKGRIAIQVKAGSSATAITGYDDASDSFKMIVKAVPKNGKANDEIIKYLRKLTKEEWEIIIGKASKRKILRIKHNQQIMHLI